MNEPVAPTPLFGSVLCGADHDAAGIAARRQAQWLADGPVVVVPTRELTTHGPDALAERTAGHDLLVLPSEPAAHALLRDVTIPVLLARWCPGGGDVTDLILVAVGDQLGASRVAGLAAQLARRHGGTVSVVAAPGRSHELGRALAATARIVVSTLGASPEVLGQLAPPHVAVPAAAAQTGASLVVAGVGDDAWPPTVVTDVARHTGCSTLAVPAPARIGRRFVRPLRDRELMLT